MNSLKPFGRPSKSGLSVKELGLSEYHRRRWLMRRPPVNRAPNGSGPKLLGEVEYMRRRRASMKASRTESC